MNKNLADHTDEELATIAQTGLQGQQALVESNRRLREAITKQIRSTNKVTLLILFLTGGMALLAAVQVGLIVAQLTD